MQTVTPRVTPVIQFVPAFENRWNRSGLTTLSPGEKIIYSGHEDETHEHSGKSIVMMMSECIAKAKMEWEPVFSRKLMARFNSGRRKNILSKTTSGSRQGIEACHQDRHGGPKCKIDSTTEEAKQS